jgi:hypothetical protein
VTTRRPFNGRSARAHERHRLAVDVDRARTAGPTPQPNFVPVRPSRSAQGPEQRQRRIGQVVRKERRRAVDRSPSLVRRKGKAIVAAASQPLQTAPPERRSRPE